MKYAIKCAKANEIATNDKKLVKSSLSVYEILIHALIASSKQEAYKKETMINLYWLFLLNFLRIFLVKQNLFEI